MVETARKRYLNKDLMNPKEMGRKLPHDETTVPTTLFRKVKLSKEQTNTDKKPPERTVEFISS